MISVHFVCALPLWANCFELSELQAAQRVEILIEVVLPVTSESYIAQARTNGRKHGCKTDCSLVGRCVYGGRRTRGRDEEADRP